MNFRYLISILFILSSLGIFSQKNDKNSLDYNWSLGAGVTNNLIIGDLSSLNSEKNNPINLGFYFYVNKMISSKIGFELNIKKLKLRASSNESFAVLYIPENNGLYSEGKTDFGIEINTIFNIFELLKINTTNKKITFKGYLGIGYHTYDSKLYDLTTNELLTTPEYFETSLINNGKYKSFYYVTGLGLNYKLSDNLDFEFRQTLNINKDDNLEGTISDKNNLELFTTSNFGLMYKFY